MADPTDTSGLCYPWFHAEFTPLIATHSAIVRSGCGLNAQGNIGCDPEAMRRAAEAKMRELGWNKSLSLETYTLARYMQGEVGSGTVEERVAVGEAAVNRAKLERLPQGVLSLLLYRQAQGHPNRGFYGPIHGPSGISTAPYGRWATTSADPSVLTIMLAELVSSGKSGNFAKKADDQDGPEYWISQGQAALHGYVRSLAARGKYWIGPLPGIDHWHTFLQTTPGINVNTPAGQALLQRGLEALTLPRRSPQWPADLPVCGKPVDAGMLFALLAGIIGGAWWAARAGRSAV